MVNAGKGFVKAKALWKVSQKMTAFCMIHARGKGENVW